MASKLPKVLVVIVGMGWAGRIIASELTKAGIKVVGLERGKERKMSDYTMVHDELRFQFRTDSGLGKPYNPTTQTGTIGKNYCCR
ncbi:hypothetical protein RGU73_15105 [Neobacillus cucumis]|uniref:hypothetical protein n=1 Tax=Neobacillus cucumis TaxID=1740721 RepID=UPI00285371AD|nr:hypothetical protein [Neobacillus cucumis]MDR4947697.1 hypothetical protein [Neobacillus cucumis]